MNQGNLGFPNWKYGPIFCYKKWDAFAPPDEVPHSFSCEFTDPGDVHKFKRVNTDGVTNLSFDSAQSLGKGLYMTIPNLQYRWRCFLLPFTMDTEFTIFAGIFTGVMASSALVAGGGILFSTTGTTNTGTQKGMFYGSVTDSNNLSRYQFSWVNFGETATGAASTLFGMSQVKHLRWTLSGSNHYTSWSEDGETYFTSPVSGGLGFTPGFMGLWGINYSGLDPTVNDELTIGFPYFRYYPRVKKKSGRLVNVYR